VFVVALPAECRASVYGYLAERIDIEIPVGGDPLVMTSIEAAAVLKLAIELSAVGDAA
jgi:hypothetical protein